MAVSIPGPWGMAPMCDEKRFAAILAEMVAEKAPRLFAVVQEYGERVDGRIAAWGMAFDDHVEVSGVDGDVRMSLSGPERALHVYRRGSHITPRLVWVK